MNTVNLIGRLTATPELKHTPNGIPVTSVNIAVNRGFKGKEEERQADFISLVAWRNTAEFLCKYFEKGQMLGVNGSLQTRSYTDKQDNKRTITEVIVSNFYFCGTQNKKQSTESLEENPITAFQTDEFIEVTSDDDMPF